MSVQTVLVIGALICAVLAVLVEGVWADSRRPFTAMGLIALSLVFFYLSILIK